MKPPYRTTAKVGYVNGETFTQHAFHVCGFKMLECVSCGRVFCPDCDAFYSKMPKCCRDAIDVLNRQKSEKQHRKDKIEAEIKKRAKRRRERYKVVIEEVGREL